MIIYFFQFISAFQDEADGKDSKFSFYVSISVNKKNLKAAQEDS